MIYNSWDNLPIGKLNDVNNIINNNELNEDDKIIKLGALISNMDYEDFINLKIEDAQKIISQIKFLYEAPKNKKLVKNLNLDGINCKVIQDVSEITTAQFIDYNTLISNGNVSIPEILSVFIIPHGHKYSDNYNKEEIVELISKYVSVEEGISIANFFIKKYKRLLMRTLLYSKVNLKIQLMKRLPQQTKEEIKSQIQQIKELQKEIRYLFG